MKLPLWICVVLLAIIVGMMARPEESLPGETQQGITAEMRLRTELSRRRGELTDYDLTLMRILDERYAQREIDKLHR